MECLAILEMNIQSTAVQRDVGSSADEDRLGHISSVEKQTFSFSV